MRVVLLLLVVLLAGCAQSPADTPDLPETYQDEPPPARENLWLLDGPRPIDAGRVSNGAEPQILADKDGPYLWAADTSGGYRSTDNGTTWQRMTNPFFLTADGWSLAEDDTGTLYASTTAVPWISVYRSDDDGASWHPVSGRFAEVAPIADRPWIAAQGDGDVFLFHYDFGRTFSESCAHSTDGGLTWADRSALMASPQGGRASVDAAGNTYISDDSGTLYRFSGSCLSPASKQMFTSKGSQHMVHTTAVRDEVYTAAPTSGNGAVVVAGTKGWGQPQRITLAPDALASNTFAVVSAHDDEVAVAWYGSETSGDPGSASFDGAWNVFVARITDFWGTPRIEYIRITGEPNHVGDICMAGTGCTTSNDRDLLDYFAIDHDRWGGIHIAYGHDGSGSKAEVRYAHLLPRDAPAPEANGDREDGEGQGSDDEAGDAPTAAFELESDGLTVQVDASGSSGEGLSYGWSFGDGATATGETAEHTYDDTGAYRIRLDVVDAAGREASAERGVVVSSESAPNEAPRASFQVEGDRRVGQTVRFVDASEDDGNVVAWSWDLGDGTVLEGQEVEHVFTASGDHTVRLTVTDEHGATGAASARVPIAPVVKAAQAPPASTPLPFVVVLGALALALARRTQD